MKPYYIRELKEALKAEIIIGDGDFQIFDVAHDSRKAQVKDLFFAIKGENLDGHQFLASAADGGCRAFVISDIEAAKQLKQIDGAQVLLVKDTSQALADLSSYYLSSMNIKIIGVTGSVGKTSTKDMVYAICASKFKTQCTKGNFNNHIGMPLTILSFPEDTEVGVLEMGMDKLGEIEHLAATAKPYIGIITNVGISHIENLGTRENIFKAKMEIASFFGKDSLLVVNEGDFLNRETLDKYDGFDVEIVGASPECDLVLTEIKGLGPEGISFTLTGKGQRAKFRAGIPGVHNCYNGGLAVCAAMKLGMTMEEAAAGLAKAQLTGGRLALEEGNGIKVIDDTYNASPDSVKAGIDFLTTCGQGRKVAILGDMYEIGKEEDALHKGVGQYAKEKNIDLVIGVGPKSLNTAEGAEGISLHYMDKEGFIADMDKLILPGDIILVKGSRGMAMEVIVKALLKEK